MDRNTDQNETADPCQQLLTPKGNANGLHKRCEAIGTGGGAAKGDFNKDGFADLAVGVPNEDVNGVGGVGAVNIIYGSASGLTSTGDQVFYETDFGFSLASSDHFGSALASGDFNGDGFSDLAIGMPDRDSGTFADAGKVLLINGGSGGLNLSTERTLSLLSGGQGNAGAALVWADFNGDGFGDLAVGIPGRKLSFPATGFF
ncbi:MAG TPA: FG-GAP-like repeat-containing protein, partial [Pyrinomonadaceae bacterium]|nr:FG-GAP-like repeat-containing protein [Pyrinomonadaceae bacterium]